MITGLTMAKVMTPSPFTIEVDEKIHRARRIMHLHRIRHLPVRCHGRLVGLVGDRDLKATNNYRYRHDLTVADIMIEDPLVVAQDEPAEKVVATMFHYKFDAALIADANGRLLGIFTTHDALRLLVTPRRQPAAIGLAA